MRSCSLLPPPTRLDDAVQTRRASCDSSCSRSSSLNARNGMKQQRRRRRATSSRAMWNPFGRSESSSSSSSSSFPRLGQVNEIETVDELERCIRGAQKTRLSIVSVATSHCGPCKMIKPTFTRFSRYYDDCVFLYCVSDKNERTKEVADSLCIGEVPAFSLFRDGELVWRYASSSENVLRMTIKEHLREGEKGGKTKTRRRGR